MNNGIEPIGDEELLFRRIPTSTEWYDRDTGVLKPQAFAPDKSRDVTGLSVAREKYNTAEQAAVGRPGKSYYVAVLCAGDLRGCGIQVVHRPHLPSGYEISHAELPGLNSANRKETSTLESQRMLAGGLCLRVEGPFSLPEE